MLASAAWSAVLLGVAVVAVIAVIGVVVAMSRRRKNDWGGPPVEHHDSAPYGAGRGDYPTAPAPESGRSMSEGVEGPPQEHDEPTRIDSSEQFREQHRLTEDGGSAGEQR